MDPQWARDILSQCVDAGAVSNRVAFFMKQMGTWWAKAAEITDEGPKVFSIDSHGGDPTYWPPGLNVREWPNNGDAGSTVVSNDQPFPQQSAARAGK